MKKSNKKLSYNASVRWDYDLIPAIEKWFEKNPGWTVSRVINQAVRRFISIKYATDPIYKQQFLSKLQSSFEPSEKDNKSYNY